MDKPIAVGDLVVVMRPSKCQCNRGEWRTAGLIFRVAKIRMSSGRFCSECGSAKPDALVADPDFESRYIFTLDRLKRIPPLEELEGSKTEENIKEPA